jgi:hypothetical protein
MRRLIGLMALATALAAPALAGDDEKVKPIPLPMNTEDDEDEPHVAENGVLFLFTRVQGGKELLMTTRRKSASAKWPTKSEEIEDYVANKGDIRGAYATVGAHPRYLFFAAKDVKGKNYDLFVAVQQDVRKAWTAPTPVRKVNTPNDECHPWLSGDGKMLYFSRRAKGVWKQMSSKRSTGKGPQGWDDPVAVGLPDGFHHAATTRDGKLMFVQGPLEKGRQGIFVAKKDGKEWARPEPLTSLNDESGKVGDKSPSLSRDGKWLYWASDRDGGKGGLDLYAIEVAKLNIK